MCILCVRVKTDKLSFEPFCVWILIERLCITMYDHFDVQVYSLRSYKLVEGTKESLNARDQQER